jgi:catalase (peroxidase I)
MFCRFTVFTLAVIVGPAVAFAPSGGGGGGASLARHHKDTTALSAQDGDASSEFNTRRNFLMTSGLATLSLLATPKPAMAAGAGTVDYKAVSQDIAALVKANPDWGPTFVRLAWHSSGTYDKMSQTGGSGGGTIRFKEELAHGGNAGLGDTAVQWLEPVYKKYADQGLSYADLYTLGGGT